MCDRDVKGVLSIFKVIRSPAVLARMFPILDLSCEKNTRGGSGSGHRYVAQTELLKFHRNGQFPHEFVTRTLNVFLGNTLFIMNR